MATATLEQTAGHADTAAQYEQFLAAKRFVAEESGFHVGADELGDWLFPFQKAVAVWALAKGKSAVFMDTGLGKALAFSEPVLMATGDWREIGSLTPGELVMGRNGTPCRVTGVYPQGERDLFRVTFSDGAYVDCDGDHLWAVRTKVQKYRGEDYRVKTLNEIIQIGLFETGGAARHFIPMCEPQEFPQRDLPIDPYTLGVLIGDGHIGRSTPSITTDIENVDRMVTPEWSEPNFRGDVSEGVATYDFCNRPRGGKPNPLAILLRGLGLCVKSIHKFIPEEYLSASIEQRKALLAGLMDTDGFVCEGNVGFCTSSPALAEGFTHLVQSLGGTAKMNCKPAPKYTHKGEKLTGHPAWHCSVQLDFNPFTLKRKALAWKPRTKYSPTRSIKKVEPIGRGQAVCIAVDAPDRLFITRGCVVTHNTRTQLEWAKHVVARTGRRVLILAPLAVASQTALEGPKGGVHVTLCRTNDDVRDGINIVNYDRMHLIDFSQFSGVVLDESSLLKSADGKTRSALIECCAGIPYRLCCTATPAPNDHTEIGNHAEFLGVMTRVEMLSCFFMHDGGETSKWTLKGHAEQPFWQWVSTWAVAVRKPSDLGPQYSNKGYDLPPLEIIEHRVEVDSAYGTSQGALFEGEATTMLDQRRAKRESLGARVATIADIVAADPEEQWLIFCELNAEADALAKAIPGAVNVQGSDTADFKEKMLTEFAAGRLRVLVSKSSICGFGMNFQGCRNVAFVGVTHSFEQFYQAVRRCWRFGQTRTVRCHVAYGELEAPIVRNLRRKEQDMERMSTAMVELMQSGDQVAAAQGGLIRDQYTYQHADTQGQGWRVTMGDCVEGLRTVDSDSIGYSIFSPPFASLYTYTNSDRDMGNCKTHSEFYEHFKFAIKELYRVLMPGRLLSFHCMNLPTSKERDGVIGITDFRGELIRLFQAEGFIYHSEVCIWKDPVTAMQRTKALGLLYKQIRKDSCMSRQGIPDYLVTMRKPGVNPEPCTKTPESFPVGLWQNYASPVWMDINPSETLQKESARAEKDDRHIAPLQLQVIERGIKLWTNEGDLVLSPFAGIGSEGYVALKMKRRFRGFELKDTYYGQCVANLRAAEHLAKQKTLFSDFGDDDE